MGSLPALLFMLVVADRTDARLASAERARPTDLARAEADLDAAWIYLSPLFETHWRGRGAERAKLRSRLEDGERGLEVARQRPGLEAARDDLTRRLEAARAVKRPVAATLGEIAETARTCWEQASMLGLEDVMLACKDLAERADQAAASATEAARVRDAELRAVLSGDRLALYEQYGEPVGTFASDDAQAIARAPTWVFVIGPTGALKSYERLVVTFKGNKIASKKRTTSKEAPAP